MRQLAQALTLPGGSSDPGGGWTAGSTTLTGPATSITSLGGLITRIIPYTILLAGVGMLLMIIFAGFQLLTGANDPKQLEMGRKRLTFGIAGFLIIFMAFWIVQAVGIIFGLNEFACVFGTLGGVACQ